MHSIVITSRLVRPTLIVSFWALLLQVGKAQTQEFYRQGDSISVRISNALGSMFGKRGNTQAAIPQQPRYQYTQPRTQTRVPQQTAPHYVTPQTPRYKQAPTTVARSTTSSAPRSTSAAVTKSSPAKSKSTATTTKTAAQSTAKSTAKTSKTAVASTSAKKKLTTPSTTKPKTAVAAAPSKKKSVSSKTAIASTSSKKKAVPTQTKSITKKAKYSPPAIEEEEEPEVTSSSRYVSMSKESKGLVYAPTPSPLPEEPAAEEEKQATQVASNDSKTPGISPFLDGYSYVGEGARAAIDKQDAAEASKDNANESPVSAPETTAEVTNVPSTENNAETAASTPTEPESSTTSLVQPKVDVSDFPVGTAGSAEGLVKSPYPPYQELDVTDMASGALALDPTVNKVFRVP